MLTLTWKTKRVYKKIKLKLHFLETQVIERVAKISDKSVNKNLLKS